jgi:hypothetical protein
MTPELSGPGTLAVLVAVCMALLKIIERLLDWVGDKVFKKKDDDDCPGDEQIGQIHSIVTKLDLDGTPMVYSSRSNSAMLKSVVDVVRDVSNSQERIAQVLEKMSDRFQTHDTKDQVFQSQIREKLEAIDSKLGSGKGA